jgi:hypothetical protein
MITHIIMFPECNINLRGSNVIFMYASFIVIPSPFDIRDLQILYIRAI